MDKKTVGMACVYAGMIILGLKVLSLIGWVGIFAFGLMILGLYFDPFRENEY